jgi:deoxycytidylate deaminase
LNLKGFKSETKRSEILCDAEGDMIAFAYNGTVRGMDNCCEDEIHNEDGGSYLVTKPDTIHAEPNLVAHCARRGISLKGGTVFVTHSPCMPCAALMIQAGVSEVYFDDIHPRSYEDTKKKYSGMFTKFMKFEG